MKYLIDLEPEQVGDLVRQEIQWQLHNGIEDEKTEEALKIVLAYYSVPSNADVQ